jgi:hypothetical protein
VSPNDFKIFRTKWRSNENFMGTYAFATTKTKPLHWSNMEKPISACNWYFCGEHTSFQYRGSVHGAFLSGIKVGKMIKKNGQGSQQSIDD